MSGSVTSTHPAYSETYPDWELVRDVTEGERRIKSKGTTYLPIPALHMANSDGSPNLEYIAYKTRAAFQNFTGRTLDSMVGAVFRKDPSTNEQQWGAVRYLFENIDGQNTSFILQAKTVCRNVVGVGRDCLLVDFPEGQADASLEDVERGLAVATIQRRTAEQVINWRWDPFGAEHRLVLVVIKEEFNKSRDEFVYEKDIRYRVLRLVPQFTEEGVPTGEAYYVQEIYIESLGLEAPQSRVMPMANGQPLQFIPFVFVGIEQNNAEVQKPPVLDIANTNLAHYRVDAEQKHTMHKHSLPQPVVEGADQQFIKKYEEEPLTLGGDTVLLLPVNSRFHIAQTNFDHTGFHSELERLEVAMKKMGARLLDDDNRARESGDALSLRRQAENSVMSSIAKNVSAAYELCVTWAGLFMGASVNPLIKLNTDFKMKSADANQIVAMSQEVDKEHISLRDHHQWMRDSELLEPGRSTDEIVADIEKQPPSLTEEVTDDEGGNFGAG